MLNENYGLYATATTTTKEIMIYIFIVYECIVKNG